MLSQKNTYIRMIIFSFFIYTNYAVVNPHFSILFKLKGFSPSWIGLIVSAFFVGGAIGPIVFSKLIQRSNDYRMVFIIIYLGLMLGSIGILKINFFPLLLIIVVFTGAFMYSLAPLSDAACTSILYNPYKEYGVVRAMGTIGYIFAAVILLLYPVLIDIKSETSIQRAIFITASISLLAIFVVPRANEQKQYLELGGDKRKKTSIVSDIKNIPPYFYILLVLVFFNFAGLASMVSFLPLLLIQDFDVTNVSGVWIFAATSELLGLFYGQRVVAKIGYVNSFYIVLFSTVLRLVLLALSSSIYHIYFLVQPLHIFGFALAISTIIHFVNNHIKSHLKATAFSFVQLSITLGRVCIISAGGVVLDYFGFKILYFFSAAFVAIGIVILAFFSPYMKKNYN